LICTKLKVTNIVYEYNKQYKILELNEYEKPFTSRAMIIMRVLRRGGLTKKRNSASGGQV